MYSRPKSEALRKRDEADAVIRRDMRERGIRFVPGCDMGVAKEVYIMESAGLLKIGYSWVAASRAKSIQSACPAPVRLLRAFSVRGDCACRIEALAHLYLADVRVRGEWFNVTLRQAVAAIERAIKETENDDDPFSRRVIDKYAAMGLKGYALVPKRAPRHKDTYHPSPAKET